ncbi:MAG: hypothetical protein IQL11_16570 [Bacteroidales bacterium]|nr:hypothetical protein [Bacteroidales bacterium]
MNRIVVRNILLFTVLILILVLVSFLRGRSPFGNKNSSFASEPKEQITKIEFSSRKEKLVLQKEGEEWLVNSTYPARKSSILFMIRILTEMKIKSPVSPELFREEISVKEIPAVRVKVFERNRIIKTFLVYKTRSNVYGNIMKMNELAKPFIVYVPGFDGDIGSGFILNELVWQPNTVFNLLPSEISSVTLENFADTSSSFSITQTEEQGYILSDLRTRLSGWDSSRIRRYLSYLTFIQFEKWEPDISDEERHKIESGKPAYKIQVQRTNGDNIVLSLWQRPGESGTADSDRMLGKTETRDDFFIIKYFDIDPLLKKRSYFFSE